MDIDEQARSRVGQVYKQKYTLGRLIGSGGMAAVYEATHRNGHRVAIKVLHRHIAANGDLRARFLREGYVANKVGHPGAVRVIDDDIAEDESVFLVMDLLEGETLDARARRFGGRLPAHEMCTLAFQALDVLAAAHEKGVVHRDVKPENLFLTVDGALKVLDFGIARVLMETTEKQTATRAGITIGTPAFMAPEQALGQSARVDGQTDLWAVAATMFTMISGQFVHEAETMEEMLIRAGSVHARSVLVAAPDLPPRVANVIDRALSFTKTARWPDARVMQSVLEDAYQFSYGAPIPEGRDSSRAPSSRAAAFAPTVNAGTLAEHLAFPLIPLSSRIPTPEGVVRDRRANWIPQDGGSGVGPNSTTNGVAQDEIRLPVRVQWGTLLLGVCVLAGVVAAAVAIEHRVAPSEGSASPALSTGPTAASAATQLPEPPVSLAPEPPAAPLLPVAPEAPATPSPPVVPEPSAPSAAPSIESPSPVEPTPSSEATPPVARPAVTLPPPAKVRRNPEPPPVVKPARPEFVPPMPFCNPNFVVDSEGNKIFKPECFPGAPPL
jgi:eukaryotic-like serine/threonine-protein kinase